MPPKIVAKSIFRKVFIALIYVYSFAGHNIMKDISHITNNKKQRVTLLMGGNLGDVKNNFTNATGEISNSADILKESALYKTQAWGMESAPDFLNIALEIETSLSPELLLNELLHIEKKMGRERVVAGYHDRVIDIDIIFYGDHIIDTEKLKVPHPKMTMRKFVLIPLAEIIPEEVHPVYGKTVRELLNDCNDTLEVEKL